MLVFMQKEVHSALADSNIFLAAISFAGSVIYLASIIWLLCVCAGKTTEWQLQESKNFVLFTTMFLVLGRVHTQYVVVKQFSGEIIEHLSLDCCEFTRVNASL